MARPQLASLILMLLPLSVQAAPPLRAPHLPAPSAAHAMPVNGDAAMPDTLTGRWIVTELVEAAVPPDVPVTLEFAETGGLSGRSGCNSFSARLKVSGQNLSPGPARSTKKACESKVMAVEAAFMRALDRLTRYDIAEDGTLVLYGFDTVMMRARREDPAQ